MSKFKHAGITYYKSVLPDNVIARAVKRSENLMLMELSRQDGLGWYFAEKDCQGCNNIGFKELCDGKGHFRCCTKEELKHWHKISVLEGMINFNE